MTARTQAVGPTEERPMYISHSHHFEGSLLPRRQQNDPGNIWIEFALTGPTVVVTDDEARTLIAKLTAVLEAESG